MKKLFFYFFITTIALFYVITIIVEVFFSISIFFYASIGVVSVVIYTLVQGYVQVKNNYVYVVELFGKYYKTFTSGPYVFFPFFNFIQLKKEIFLGVKIIELYIDEKGGGTIEFKDCSSSITSYLYYKINDAYRAAYETADLTKSVRELTDHLLRSFFGVYTIDEAIALKGKIGLVEITCLVHYNERADSTKVFTENDFEKTDFFKTLSEWGVHPEKLVLSDINLPPEILEGRERVFLAEQRRQATEKEKEIALIEASQRKEVAAINKKTALLEGKAMAERIKIISEETGLSSNEVVAYLNYIEKWSGIGKSATVIIGSREGEQGSAIGAGLASQIRTKRKEE